LAVTELLPRVSYELGAIRGAGNRSGVVPVMKQGTTMIAGEWAGRQGVGDDVKGIEPLSLV